MKKFRISLVAVVGMTLWGCTTSPLPPGANYLSPFAGGIAPARLYAAQTRRISGTLTAYNVIPICRADFTSANELKTLTSSESLSYGDLTITDGPSVLASISGIPISTIATASAGVGYSDRNTMTISNARLVQADNERVAEVIANYVRKRGNGTPDKPRCLDIVQKYLSNQYTIIVTQGVLTSNTASFAPEAGAGTATCGASDTKPKEDTAKKQDTSGKDGSASQPSNLLATLFNAATKPTDGQASKQKPAEGDKPAAPQAAPKKRNAPISGCVDVSLAKTFSIKVKGEGGNVYDQTLSGAVVAILPEKLPGFGQE
jgi:hypothetical protein